MSVQDGIDFASEDGNTFTYPDMTGAASFAIARAAYTYGGVAKVDPTFATLRAHVPAGWPVGGYMILGWSKTGASPAAQAASMIAAYGDRRPGELPPSLDLEADSASAVGRTAAECLDWAHAAYDALVERYGVVMVYTSARVWSDVFGDVQSRMGRSPGWIKIPYPYKADEPARPDECPAMEANWIPVPWRAATSPSARIEQYQGDALGVTGCTSTVDLNRFLPLARGAQGTGVAWMQTIVGAGADGAFGPNTEAALQQWQTAHGLAATGVVDLATFIALAS